MIGRGEQLTRDLCSSYERVVRRCRVVNGHSRSARGDELCRVGNKEEAAELRALLGEEGRIAAKLKADALGAYNSPRSGRVTVRCPIGPTATCARRATAGSPHVRRAPRTAARSIPIGS